MADKISVTISKEKIREKISGLSDQFSGKYDSFTDGLTDKQERLLKANVFMAKMLTVGAVFHAILFIYPNTTGIQTSFAGILTDFMNFFGYSFSHQGVLIMGDTTGYEVTQDCLGWKSMMAFTALMISSGNVKRNLQYLAGGLFLIVVANFVRVVSTIHLAEIGIFSFEIIHGFLWRWSLTAVVLLAWIIWFQYYRD